MGQIQINSSYRISSRQVGRSSRSCSFAKRHGPLHWSSGARKGANKQTNKQSGRAGQGRSSVRRAFSAKLSLSARSLGGRTDGTYGDYEVVQLCALAQRSPCCGIRVSPHAEWSEWSCVMSPADNRYSTKASQVESLPTCTSSGQLSPSDPNLSGFSCTRRQTSHAPLPKLAGLLQSCGWEDEAVLDIDWCLWLSHNCRGL